jgi:predicted SnoaL-like aldol condensation-catalyzing enzyme
MSMKYVVAISIIASLVALDAAGADVMKPGDMAAANSPKGRIGVAWVDGMFNKCDPKSVFDKYVDPANYHNHPAARDGNELAMEQAVFSGVCAKGTRAIIKAVVVQGDLVVVMASLTGKPEAILSEWFRIKNGKIAAGEQAF